MKNVGLGKLAWWKRLVTAVATVFGGAVGGPIGAVLAGIVMEYLWGLDGGINGLGAFVESDIEILELTDEEGLWLERWVLKGFAPTILYLSNKVDSIIEVSGLGRIFTTSSSTDEVVKTANSVLKDIAVFRAYNKMIRNYNELKIDTGSFSTNVKWSQNFSTTKANFSDYWLNMLEKAVLKYIEENIKDQSGLTLVSNQLLASDTPSIYKVGFEWHGRTIATQYKRYVLSTEDFDEMDDEIIVPVNTDISNTDSTTNGEGEDVVELDEEFQNPIDLKIPSEASLPKGWAKVLAIVGVAYVGKTLFTSKKKKEKE